MATSDTKRSDAKRGPTQRGDAKRKDAPRAGGGPSVWSEYLRQSSRPLASLALVAPMLVAYEAGVLVLGPQAVRNGADIWLRQLLHLSGFTQYFLLPTLTVGLLLAWHHVTRDRWQVSAAVVYMMFAECAVLGLVLLGLGRLQGLVAQAIIEPQAGAASFAQMAAAGAAAPAIGRLVGYLGAGVYEEMLFRLLLLPPVSGCVRRLGARRGLRVTAAIVLTSLLFSAAHYVGPHGDAFDAFSFGFRLTAGALFAVLFVYRGFGIAAGTHALYDVFVSF